MATANPPPGNPRPNLESNQLSLANESSISPSVDQFAEILSTVPSWYNLGVYLGAPMVELDVIKNEFSDGTYDGTLRCLMELYKCLERKGKSLSWETIAFTLRRIDNHTLADKVNTIKEQQTSMEPRPFTSGSEGIEYIKVSSTLTQKYEELSKKFIILLTNVKSAFDAKTFDMSKMQDLIKRQCGLPRLPQEVATIDTVFDRVEEECSILNFCLLELLVEELLLSSDVVVSALKQDIEKFKLSVDDFKKSANMVELVRLTKSKQTTALSGNQQIVELKVQEFWNKFTMEQFEKIMNTIFKALYDIMRHIDVKQGCICLNWIIPDIDTTELLPVLPLELVRLIGVIYLHIGSDVIYNIEGEGYESIEAAMLQAVEVKNTRAIELLIATFDGDTVTNTNIHEVKPIKMESRLASYGHSHIMVHHNLDNSELASRIFKISSSISELIVMLPGLTAAMMNASDQFLKQVDGMADQADGMEFAVKATKEYMTKFQRCCYVYVDAVNNFFHYGCHEEDSNKTVIHNDNFKPLLSFLASLATQYLGKSDERFIELQEACKNAEKHCINLAIECNQKTQLPTDTKDNNRKVVGGVGSAAAMAIAVGTGVGISILAGMPTFGIVTVIGLGITATAATSVGAGIVGSSLIGATSHADYFKEKEKKFSELARNLNNCLDNAKRFHAICEVIKEGICKIADETHCYDMENEVDLICRSLDLLFERIHLAFPVTSKQRDLLKSSLSS